MKKSLTAESRAANEDLFIMSISMQNHGGYTEKYDNFDEKVRLLGIKLSDVNQYLSGARERFSVGVSDLLFSKCG